MKIILTVLGLCLLLGTGLAQGQGAQEGQEIFNNICAMCHRENGEGLPGTFPALNGDPFVVGDPRQVISTVLNGRKGKLGQMPTWKDRFDDRQIAAVVTYIRHAWSNKAGPVTPDMVAAIRSSSR